MKFLHVVHYPVFGGPHNRAIRLQAPLAQRGWHTLVLLPDDPGNAADRLTTAGVDVLQIPLHRLRESRSPLVHMDFARRFPSEVAHIRRLIRQRNIDLVLINGLVNPHSAIAARMEGIPVVWQVLDTRTPTTLRKLMMPLVSRLADVVMSTGIAVAEVHPGAMSLGDRLVPFFPAVDVNEFHPDADRRAFARRSLGIETAEIVIGNLSNINPQKGHGTFIRAAAALKRTHPNVKFVILGATYDHHSGYAASLWREAEELGLRFGNDLIVRDPESQAHELLPAFDVFWMTSGNRSEGIPTVVEEAMACGLPVVATDIGSVREAVEDGVTGFIVPPQNPEPIAVATRRILQDTELRGRLGTASRRRAVEQFDLETCANTHVRAFERAIEHQRRRSKPSTQVSPISKASRPRRTLHQTRSQIHHAKRLGKKLANVAPIIASHPRLIPLMRNGVHPEHYARLDVAWLKDAKINTVLDIGANTGQFTGAAHARFPHATIYAFEPQEECFQALSERYSDVPTIHAFHTAVGDDDGEITLHRNTYSQSSSLLEMTDRHRKTFPWAASSTEVQVPIRRLDSLASELRLTPNVLVKIDVQGYEDRVLRGGEHVIRAAQFVLVETAFEPLYEGEANFSTVYETMASYGFRFAGVLDQMTSPANDLPLYADALFIRDN